MRTDENSVCVSMGCIGAGLEPGLKREEGRERHVAMDVCVNMGCEGLPLNCPLASIASPVAPT